MVFKDGAVKVVTKSKEVIKGTLMPYEDVERFLHQDPTLKMLSEKMKKDGIFIFTGKHLSYVDRGEIRSMKKIKFT